MAGQNSLFNADEFRANIKAAMAMGSPTNPTERATFQWRSTSTYTRQDVTSRPYDWTSTAATTDAPEDVQVDCAVEFSRAGEGTENAVGSFENPRAIITLLDEDYELVRGASHVLLGSEQSVYEIEFVAPPMGLFDVTVYQMYTRAVSEGSA